MKAVNDVSLVTNISQLNSSEQQSLVTSSEKWFKMKIILETTCTWTLQRSDNNHERLIKVTT